MNRVRRVHCSDDFDYLRDLDMARYLTLHAFRTALQGHDREEVVRQVMDNARSIAVDLLVERGMSKTRAEQLVDYRKLAPKQGELW